MEDFVCPVCREARAPFRVYACGHSACTECMRRCDETDHAARPHAGHRCPMCRAATLTPWHARPWNRALNAQLQLREEDEGPGEDDLCALATLQRIALCEALLPALLLRLREAADAGEALVTFDDARVVEGVRKVGPMIAEKLFRRGVYRLEIREGECLVSLVPCDATVARKRVFVNPGFLPDV